MFALLLDDDEDAVGLGFRDRAIAPRRSTTP
jgi:hypothetical protein